jgi:peptidoglycan biosynthesis protein MviN/MurJ (putative lipid II flippase)
MFSFGWGIAGAATATVFSQYVQMSILLFCMAKRCRIVPHRWRELKFRRFLGAGEPLCPCLEGRNLVHMFEVLNQTVNHSESQIGWFKVSYVAFLHLLLPKPYYLSLKRRKVWTDALLV